MVSGNSSFSKSRVLPSYAAFIIFAEFNDYIFDFNLQKLTTRV